MRDACARIVGGAKLCTPAITSAPSACLDSFSPSISRVTKRSRSTGSAMYTGSGPRIATMRLPPSKCSSSVLTETGTSARSSTPSVRAAREIRKVRSAPATIVSTTSLTVPPNAFLTSLKSSRLFVTPTKRRCGPIGTLSSVLGAGFRAAQAISPMPSTASHTRASARSGWNSAPAAPCASSSPVRDRAPQAGREQLRGARFRVRFPGAPRARQGWRLGAEIEQHGRPGRPGDPVDQRVVVL